MRFQEMQYLWKMFRTIVLIVGIILSFFSFIEILRVYITLREIHPLLGYLFFLTLITFTLLGIFYFLRSLKSRPKVLSPPSINNNIDNSTKDELQEYSIYLVKYLKRLEANNIFNDEEKKMAHNCWSKLEETTKKNTSCEILQKDIHETEDLSIEPLLKKLDENVDKRISAGVRDVMIGVTLSPYRSADLFVVIYRNLAMVIDIISIYNSRPQLKEMFLIIRDTARVVAAVNYLNFGTKFIENIFKSFTRAAETISGGNPVVVVPASILGQYSDDIVQGLGAGLLTSVSGHAAKDRCKGFRGWDYEQAKINVSTHIKRFASDIKGVFFADVWTKLRNRLDISPDIWKKLTSGVTSSFNETIGDAGNFIKDSASSGVKSIGSITSAVTTTVTEGVKIIGDGTIQAGQAMGNETLRAYDKTNSSFKTAAKKTQISTKNTFTGFKRLFLSIKTNKNKSNN